MSTIILALATAALAGAADGHVVEMGTQVTGNQEQPKVLYIVPWQAPEDADVLYRDISSRIDNLLEPLDRDSFRRELDLRQQFKQLNSDNSNP